MKKKVNKEKYGKKYWTFFFIMIGLSFLSRLEYVGIVFGLMSIAYLVYFIIKFLIPSLKLAKKKPIWFYVVVFLIPFGFWIDFFIVRKELLKIKRW